MKKGWSVIPKDGITVGLVINSPDRTKNVANPGTLSVAVAKVVIHNLVKSTGPEYITGISVFGVRVDASSSDFDSNTACTTQIFAAKMFGKQEFVGYPSTHLATLTLGLDDVLHYGLEHQ